MLLFLILAALAAADNLNTSNLDAAIKAASNLAKRAVGPGGIPGLALAIVYDGKVYADGFGVRKVGEPAGITAETVFQLASLSKPLSSTVVSALVTQNKTTWDSLINEPTLIARYPDPWVSSEVRISDCFSHRSSMLGTGGDDLEIAGFDRETILTRLRYTRPSGPFRITYAYSNYGLTTGGTAAASKAGMSWEDAAQNALYAPLGMSMTTDRDSEFLSRSNRATLHYPTRQSVLAGGNRTWVASSHRNPQPQAPAGGASSNVLDLAKWIQLNIARGLGPSGQRIIREDVLAEAWTPQIVKGKNPLTGATAFYAYGWNIDYQDGYTYISHAGAFEQGSRTVVKINLEVGLGIVVLCNSFPHGWPEGISDTVMDIALYGSSRQDYVEAWNKIYSPFDAFYTSNPWEGSPPNASGLDVERYIGEYKNDYVGTVIVKRSGVKRDNGLSLIYTSGDKKEWAMTHWDRDTFLIRGQRPSENYGAIFGIGADGTADRVSLTMFDTRGSLVKVI